MKLNYTAKDIVKIEFSGAEKGYEPYEVDQVLDDIILDYQQIDNLVKEIEKLNSEIVSRNSTITDLKKQIEILSLKIQELEELRVKIETDLSFQKNRIEQVLGANRDMGSEIDNINYIRALETRLVALGGNPNEVRNQMYRRTIDISKLGK